MSESNNLSNEELSHAKAIPFLMVPLPLLKEFGFQVAGFYSYLLNKEKYWMEKSKKWDGWFFHTIKEIEENTHLGEHTQRTAIKKLQTLELLEIKYEGMPQRKWFRLNTENHYKILYKLRQSHTRRKVVTESEESSCIILKNLNTKEPETNVSLLLVESDDSTSEGNIPIKKKYTRKKKPTPRLKKVNYPKRKKKVIPIQNKIISFWNTLPGATTHRNTSSKTYKEATRLIYHLKKGTIIQACPFLQDFIVSHKLDESKLKRSLSNDRIKYILGKALKSYYSKVGQKTTLANLIYNERSRSGFYSHFCYVWSGNEFSKVDKDPSPKITARFMEILSKEDITNAFHNKLILNIEAMRSWHTRRVRDRIESEKIHHDQVAEIYSFLDLCKIYIRWLDEIRYENFPIRPYNIGPIAEGKNWGEFLVYLDEAYDIQIK